MAVNLIWIKTLIQDVNNINGQTDGRTDQTACTAFTNERGRAIKIKTATTI